METNKNSEQVADNKSNPINEENQKGQIVQKGNDIASQKVPSTDNDKRTDAEKERKSNEHEHSFKTPIAKPDVEEGKQSKPTEQDTKENQSSK